MQIVTESAHIAEDKPRWINWLDHHFLDVKTAGSNPARGTMDQIKMNVSVDILPHGGTSKYHIGAVRIGNIDIFHAEVQDMRAPDSYRDMVEQTIDAFGEKLKQLLKG